ncbi:MAG: hypothetical protein M1470_00415 [Bacteroidetes bacterium]|nr:hypothetical protein [Bacteroidota bacterium]MCL5737213.1 hypothetical protein [Bacteroidota bacterium]
MIQELCDNVYTHNEGVSHLYGKLWVRFHKSGSLLSSSLETGNVLQNYFSSFAHYDFLEISVCDNGLGLLTTLSRKVNNQIEINSPRGYLNAAFKMERGLFKVKEFLKGWGGLVVFRSGQTQFSLAYDLNEHEIRGMMDHVDLPSVQGTQVHVIVPAVLDKMKAHSFRREPTQPDLFEQPKIYESPQLHFDVVEVPPNLTDIAIVSNLLSDIKQRLALKKPDSNTMISIDFTFLDQFGQSVIRERILSEFFTKLALDLDTFTIARRLCVIGLPSRFIPIAERAAESYNKPLLLFDQEEKACILGLRKNSSSYWFLRKLIDHSTMSEKDIAAQIASNRDENLDRFEIDNTERQILHGELGFFRVDEEADSKVFRYTTPRFAQGFVETIKRVCDETKASGHFRLFSGKHSSSFLESRLILENSDIVRRIASLMAKSVGPPPQVIVSYSITGAILVYNLVRFFFKNSEIVICSDYDNVAPKIGENVALADKTVLIVTDVISDGNLVKNIADFVSQRKGNIIGISAIVSASEHIEPIALPEGTISPNFLLKYPIERAMAVDCDLCKSNVPLSEVDRFSMSPGIQIASQTPIATYTKKQEPEHVDLFKDSNNISDQNGSWLELFEIDHQIFEEKHTVRGRNHFTHYDNTERILASRNTRMVVEAAVSRILAKSKARIGHIVHPANLGATLLAQIIATRLPYSVRTTSFPQEAKGEVILPQHLDSMFSGGNILVVDDTANSGETLFSMMMSIKELTCNLLGAFVLINRLSEAAMERFRGNQFNVFSIFRVNVPVYSKDNCPNCIELKSLKVELSNCFDGQYQRFLVRRITQLRPQVFSVHGDRIILSDDDSLDSYR